MKCNILFLLVIGTIILCCTEINREHLNKSWEEIQKEYYKLSKTKNKSPKIIEHYAVMSDRKDKCVTCHIGSISNNSLSDNLLYKRHSKGILKDHNVNKFGCTICHKGNGLGLTYKDAGHKGYSQSYKMTPLKYMESTCMQCHTNTYNDDQAKHGKFLISKYGCNTCHKIDGFNKHSAQKININGIADKVQLNWLYEWLNTPLLYSKHKTMPTFNITKDETEYIVHFLSELKNPTLKNYKYQNADAINGEKLYKLAKCSRCHTRKGSGGNLAPELTNVSRKLKRTWLISFLKNPKSFYPNTKMPQYHFSEKEVLDLTEYLLGISTYHSLNTNNL